MSEKRGREKGHIAFVKVQPFFKELNIHDTIKEVGQASTTKLYLALSTTTSESGVDDQRNTFHMGSLHSPLRSTSHDFS